MNKWMLPLAILLGGCAHADYAQIADSSTTAAALSSGFAAVKLGATQAVKYAPPDICRPGAIFRAWRGDTGRQITFAGVDAETVAIPDLLGD